LTGNGTLTFHYDYRNLIVQVKSGGTVISSYRYDALGRRVEKSVVAGSLVERYIRTTAETPGHWENISHVVATFDVSNNWKQNFVWNDEVDGITMLEQADMLDYDTDTNTSEVTRSFYHRNALGSVMDITDMNQAKVVAYRYDPYGKATITVGGTPQANDPLGQHWAFTGRFLDEESGLLYYRARHYDPGTGRFVQRDPFGYAQGPSLFAYVDSNVASRSDPSGYGGDDEKIKKLKESGLLKDGPATMGDLPADGNGNGVPGESDDRIGPGHPDYIEPGSEEDAPLDPDNPPNTNPPKTMGPGGGGGGEAIVIVAATAGNIGYQEALTGAFTAAAARGVAFRLGARIALRAIPAVGIALTAWDIIQLLKD
jgi:RHS repeat-associated protein